MNNQTHKHVGAVLTAIDDITPEPPPLPTVSTRQPVHRRPLPVAAGAFAAALLVIGMVALAVRPGVDESQDVAATSSAPSPTTVPTSDQAPATPLPRFTLDLPDWSIVDINHSDLSTGAIFSENSEDGGGDGAMIFVWSDGPDDPPGTGYETALASQAEAEHLGTLSIGGLNVEAFLCNGEDPDYQFLWQNTETVTVQVVVLRADLDDAKRVVAAITPITEESWAEFVAQFPPTEMATTTMAPDTPGVRDSEPTDITTTTMP